MLRVAVLVSGSGTNLQAIIDSIRMGRISNAEIAAVISNKKDAYALTRAKNNGIDASCVSPNDYKTREEFYRELVRTIDTYQPDLIVLAGFLVILPKQLVERYPNKIINIHPSLIPSFCGDGYYGIHVHKAVLCRGVKVTGATVHFVDEGTDSGPILLQKTVSVLPEDTPETLQKRVMEEAEWVILSQAIDAIANNRVEIKKQIASIRE